MAQTEEDIWGIARTQLMRRRMNSAIGRWEGIMAAESYVYSPNRISDEEAYLDIDKCAMYAEEMRRQCEATR